MGDRRTDCRTKLPERKIVIRDYGPLGNGMEEGQDGSGTEFPKAEVFPMQSI